MTIIYVTTADNKMASAEVDENGNLTKMLQTVEPIVDPLPDNLPEKGPMGGKAAQTEWISRHPKLPILYALTSFWNEAHAIVSTFKVNDDGTLTKLGSRPTGGYQAAHAIFSPDGSTYAIAHHNGGKLSFFDVTEAEQLDEPLLIVDMPVLIDGTKKEPKAGSMDQGLPSLHGLSYSPNGKYLICADPVQNAVFTYTVDTNGRPTTPQDASSQVVCHTNIKPYGWAPTLLAKMLKMGPRPRRAVVHPNGKYLYVLHEFIGQIQIYGIDEEGNIDTKLLAEVSCFDPSFRKSWFVGVGISAVAELEVTNDALIVSSRGISFLGGRCESSVRFLAYRDEGRDLESVGVLEGVPAAVRHFYRKDNIIWVGINSGKITLVQKYEKQDDEWKLKGEADVGMDVFCVTPKDV